MVVLPALITVFYAWFLYEKCVFCDGYDAFTGIQSNDQINFMWNTLRVNQSKNQIKPNNLPSILPCFSSYSMPL